MGAPFEAQRVPALTVERAAFGCGGAGRRSHPGAVPRRESPRRLLTHNLKAEPVEHREIVRVIATFGR